ALPEARGYARRVRRRGDVPTYKRLRQRRSDAPRRRPAVYPQVGATALQPAVKLELGVHPLRRVLLLERAEAFARLRTEHAGLHPDAVEQAQVVVQAGLDHAARCRSRPTALTEKVFRHLQQGV